MAESGKATFDTPDEVRTFDKGRVEIVSVGSQKVGKSIFQPGWKWSECVKPIVGGDSCQVHHIGYIVSGSIHIVMNDGNEFDGQAGNVYEILPGHDAWVVGDEEFVGLEFQPKAVEEYAKG